MAAERAFLDTNVLLAATTPARADHGACLALLTGEAPLYASGQILREYLVVATRPIEVNGLGLGRDLALRNVAAFGSRLRLLVEGPEVHAALCELVRSQEVTGKPIHDANVVATMLVHGLGLLITANVSHFARFVPRIRVRFPS